MEIDEISIRIIGDSMDVRFIRSTNVSWMVCSYLSWNGQTIIVESINGH